MRYDATTRTLIHYGSVLKLRARLFDADAGECLDGHDVCVDACCECEAQRVGE